MINELSLFNKWPYFQFDEVKLLNKYIRWLKVADILKISKAGKQRLKWIIYYYEKADMNVSLTARHFGISRKTFHKWFREFDENNLYSMHLLEDRSKAPKHVRQKEVTKIEKSRIIKLRKDHMTWGKMKLKKLYKDEFNEKISSWKIQYVIKNKKLFLNRDKVAKLSKKRANARKQGKKNKTIELVSKLPNYKKIAGYIICLDTVEINWNGLKRYIFTAIDKYGKMAYARMYKTKSSLNGKDFLYRLDYLLDGNVPRVGRDNGSEFKKYFREGCEELEIKQYYSRVRTPKDNPDNERFNQTLQTEFINLGNMRFDVNEFNRNLTEWLIEYNFKRPHQTLNYQTPAEYSKVLPMCPSRTIH
ncbi:MAG: integrase core domain-containing protein [Candidatus Falkowbacteria bacterium]